MRSYAIISFFCAALASAEVKLCPLPPADAKGVAPVAAQMVTGNPPGAMYSADLKTGGATGSVTLSSADMGVKIDIKLKLPKEGAPFMYHIHAKTVPAVRRRRHVYPDRVYDANDTRNVGWQLHRYRRSL